MARNEETDPKITNQHDIDRYINALIKKAEDEIEILFSRRLKQIKQEIEEMFSKYQSDDVYVTWTEFNKYNRLNKELNRIGKMLTQDYREVAKIIKQSQQNAYIEKYLMSLYLYEMASQTSMDFDVPTQAIIQKAIEQPVDLIKLVPTLERHRSNVLKKIRIEITKGIVNGKGYTHIAKALRDDLGMSKAQAQRVARTEAGRAMSQAGLDSAKVAKDNGLSMHKRWLATKDTRTRHTHRHLDGQSLKLHEVFHSSGCTAQAPKLFKGDDAKAMAKENINCRCKLLYYIDEDELPTVMRTKEDGVIPFTTYRDWEKEKRKGSA